MKKAHPLPLRGCPPKGGLIRFLDEFIHIL
jgi:hypothetical protein